MSQGRLGRANPLPGCAALGKCTSSLCPVSRLRRAHRRLWWFREPRHRTFLNQPDTEKREHLLKKKQSVRRVGNSSGPRITHKAERQVCWRPSEVVVTRTLIHPPPRWTVGRDLAQHLFPPLDSEILRTAAVPSFRALSPRAVPDDPVPSPHKGSPSQQVCISDSPGDHGQTAGRLGAPGTPQSLHPLLFGPWLLSTPQS